MQLFSFPKYTFFSIALGGALALAGCTKPTSVGSDVIPASDFINGTLVISDANTADTATFRMNTSTIADTVVTYRVESNDISKVNLTRHPFGAANDPVFGKSWAGIYLQPAFDVAPPAAGFQSDSTVLVLQYDVPQGNNTFNKDATVLQKFKAGYITGDTTQAQSLNVYRVSETMLSSISTVYTSNKDFTKLNTAIGSLSYTVNPTTMTKRTKLGRNIKNTADSLYASYTMPVLRVPLTKAIGDDILSNTDKLGRNADLKTFFKGIYIEPGTNNTFLHRFALINNKTANDIVPPLFDSLNILRTQTKIIVYYHTSTGEKKAYTMVFSGAESVTSCRFQHNITGTPVAAALNPLTSKRIGDSVMYIQAMNGSIGKINFPNLAKLKGKVVINKAEIIFKTISDATSTPKPVYLSLLDRRDKDGRNYSIFQDIRDLVVGAYGDFAYGLIPAANYGGELNGGTYTINITKQLQTMVGGLISKNVQENNTIYISPLTKAANVQRVILGGARNRTYAPVLKVYMSYL
jgi:hypothetical protein